mgnify:CR=1 FL=1
MLYSKFKEINKVLNIKKKASFLLTMLVFTFLLEARANWTKVTQSNNGQSFYVDMENITENRGFVYFWELIDYNKKDEYGDKSAKIYIEADCINFKFKWIKLSYHKDKMGKDHARVQKPSYLVADWQYPVKNSTSMLILDFVCKNKGITL